MKFIKDTFFLILGIIFIGGSLFLFSKEQNKKFEVIKTVRISDSSINVEVAETPESRSRGLSGRESLIEGEGMLFVFDEPGRYGFWMKEMRFNIDIVWISEDFHVVGVEKGLTPETFPEIFYPNELVKYVLEVPAGETEKVGIDSGSIVSFE